MHELCSRHIVAYYTTLTFALPNVSAFKEPPLDLKNGTHAYTEVFITRKYFAHALGFFLAKNNRLQNKSKTKQNKTKQRERERERAQQLRFKESFQVDPTVQRSTRLREVCVTRLLPKNLGCWYNSFPGESRREGKRTRNIYCLLLCFT